MARHGENIRKRADGRWEGRYAVYSMEKGRKIYRSIYGQSYEEVRRKMALDKNTQQEDSCCPDRDILFGVAAKEWLRMLADRRKLSTCVKYSAIYNKYLAEAFADTSAADVSDALVMEKVYSRNTVMDSLSESMQKSIYCVVNQILVFAAERYAVPIQRIKRPDLKVKKRPRMALNHAEQEKWILFLYQDMDIYKLAGALCLYTGLRIGELCALKWEDINVGGKSILVERTVQRIAAQSGKKKTVLLETEPKSEYSKREIPVPDHAMKLLLKFRHDGAYIFGGNKPMEPRTLQYRFKKHLAEAGLPDKNFHTLRHTFATNCIESGGDVKSLSEVLGHSDVQITLNRYVHPSMENKRRQLEKLSQVYGHFLGQVV